MKDNIHIFDEKVEKMINECSQEEEVIAKMLLNFKENRKNKIEIINKIRESKIQEIDQELEDSKKALEELQNKKHEMLNPYCKENGHYYVVVSSIFVGSNKLPIYLEAPDNRKKNTYMCTACGEKHTVTENCPPLYPGRVVDEQKILKRLTSSDLSRIEARKKIDEEIQKIKNYIKYLYELKEHICKLFGHDAKKIDCEENFKCKCCDRTLTYQEYINAHYNAIFIGVVPFYYEDSCLYNKIDEFFLSSKAKTKSKILLPSYEDFMKK